MKPKALTGFDVPSLLESGLSHSGCPTILKATRWLQHLADDVGKSTRTFPGKPKPEYGLDWLVCAELVRKRSASLGLSDYSQVDTLADGIQGYSKISPTTL